MIWETILIGLHFAIAIALIGFVLIQHGKGADMGAAFGSGTSGSLFGAAGSANFLSRTTAILATVFFLSSLGLTYLTSMHGTSKDLMQSVTQKLPQAPAKAGDGSAPAAPTVAPGTAPLPSSDPKSKSGEVPK